MHNETWEIVLGGLVDLGAFDAWIKRSDLDEQVSLRLDRREVTKCLYSLLRFACVIDDGGYGQDRHFMVTEKGMEKLESS